MEYSSASASVILPALKAWSSAMFMVCIFHWLAQKLGPSTADSIPIPLLILGGLALALILAAGVSLLARRMQARRAAADPPPAGPSF